MAQDKNTGSYFMSFAELYEMLGIGRNSARAFGRSCSPVRLGDGKVFYPREVVVQKLQRAVETGRLLPDQN